MREEELETAIKVVVVGNGAVGKSSMIQRYCKGVFTRDYKKTIGVDFLERQIEVNGEDVRLMLWDTAGQEEFDAITKAYYRGAQACVIAFSITDRDSYDAVLDWKQKVEAEVGQITMVLVQNKMDLISESMVAPEEVDNLCRQINVKLFPTSVKDNMNVDEVFRCLAEKYLAQISIEHEEDLVQKNIGSTFCTTRSSSHLKNSNHKKEKEKETKPFSLQPSKRRTHGKKSHFASWTKCTLL